MSEGHGAPKSSMMSSDQSMLRHIRHEHLVAGISGGVSATLCLHPLDLVKIRLQGRIVLFILSVVVLPLLCCMFEHSCEGKREIYVAAL